MPRLGTLSVYATLDANHNLGTLDGREWSYLTADATYQPTSYVLSASYQYGRDRFLGGDFETGTCVIVLNNDSGEWTPISSVNETGGDKLEPGMLVSIQYGWTQTEMRDYLRTETGDNSWVNPASGTDYFQATRPVVASESWTGFVDTAAWTAHGSDLDLTVGESVLGVPGTAITAMLNPQTVKAVTRFLGRIYEIEDSYEEGGQGAVTIVTVVDLMADLAQYEPGPLVSPRAAEPTGETLSSRWAFIRAEALNDGNLSSSIGSASLTVEASTLPSNYLEEARVAARAEGGAIYARHGRASGRLILTHANWLLTDRLSATTQWHVGNARIGIRSARTKYSLSRVFNDIHYSNSSTTVTASNAPSIADHSTRSLVKTVLNNDNTDLQALADRDLALQKDAQFVIEGVTITPETLWEVMFARDVAVGDRLEVTVDVNTFSYTQTVFVSGVAESWDASSDDWSITLRLDSREGDTIIPGTGVS